MHCTRRLAIWGTIILTVACTKNDIDRQPMVETQISARIDCGQTKTLIAADPVGGETLRIFWNVGDQIGVFGSKSSNALFSNKSSEAASTAVFSGRFAEGDTPAVAYYPYVEGASSTKSVPVSIPSQQEYSSQYSIAPYDIKWGSYEGLGSDGNPSFSFTSAASILKISVSNLSSIDGMEEGEIIKSITVSNASGEALTGSFKLNAATGALSSISTDASSSLELNPSVLPAYAVIAPTVKSGDRLDITIATSGHIIMFHKTAANDFSAGHYYDVNIDVASLSEADGLLVETMAMTTKFATFSFEAAKNEGKILTKEVYYNGSKTTVKSVASQQLEIDADGNASICIPYLYDFNLVPTFTLEDSGAYDVYVGSEKQTSGVSAQDFSSPVTYRIVDRETKGSLVCTVSVSNTGLPVMVINQKSSYDSSVQFLDMTVPAKSCDFGAEDEIALYENGVAIVPTMPGGFRLRGNITQGYPKKPFAVKLSAKTSLLGMAKHKRWCLLANWKDNTNLRNDVTQMLAREITGQWSPNGEFVELVLNGEHIGLYYLCEQIKIDKNRLNIQKCYEDRRDDYAADPATNPEPSFANCGYMLEVDNYYDEVYKFKINNDSYLPINCKDDFDETTLGQSIFNQLKAKMTSIDNYIDAKNFSDAYELLDITSAANYMLVQELVMNNEYKHPRSVYLYMDGGEDKLHYGPCWDYDTWTFPVISNMKYYNSETYVHSYTDFQFNTEVNNTSTSYVWLKQLAADGTFGTEVKSRWNAIKNNPSLTPDAVDAYIDGRAAQISTSAEYDRSMWPHPSNEFFDEWMNADETTSSKGTGTMRSFQETIDLLKTAYRSRYNGLSTAVNAL